MNSFPDKKKIPILLLTNLSEKLKITKYQSYILGFFFSMNILAGIIAYGKDFANDFSSVERTGKYIVENNLQHYSAAGFIDYAVSPISAFTRNPFYYPERDTTSTFPIWTMKNYTTDMNQVMNRLLSRISKSNDTFLVVLNFDLNTSIIGNIQFAHMADFKDAIESDENFSIFLASKFNLANDLQNNKQITDEQILNYISLANGLLQQNKLDDCEKIMERIKVRADEKSFNRFHNTLGMLYAKKNNFFQAKKEFQREIDLNLQKDEAYFQLGMLFYQQQKSDSAIFAWEKTVELNPKNLDAYSNLGVCYLNFKHDSNKAEELWNKTVQFNPDYVQGYLNLMILCQNKKDENCLLNNLRIILRKGVSPNDIRARGINLTDDLLKKATS
jgi:tetratricopeptide (TPR) repeat protein